MTFAERAPTRNLDDRRLFPNFVTGQRLSQNVDEICDSRVGNSAQISIHTIEAAEFQRFGFPAARPDDMAAIAKILGNAC